MVIRTQFCQQHMLSSLSGPKQISQQSHSQGTEKAQAIRKLFIAMEIGSFPSSGSGPLQLAFVNVNSSREKGHGRIRRCSCSPRTHKECCHWNRQILATKEGMWAGRGGGVTHLLELDERLSLRLALQGPAVFVQRQVRRRLAVTRVCRPLRRDKESTR